MIPLRDARGSTLVELLVALAFVAGIAAQTSTWMRTALAAARAFDATTGRSRGLWLGLEALAVDVHNAGFSAAGTPMIGLREATPTSLSLGQDVNGDADLDDENELVRYRYVLEEDVLRRGTGTAGMQVFVDDLDGLRVEFRYRSASGARIAPDGSPLDAGQRAAVRRVDVHVIDATTGRHRIVVVALRNPA